MERMIQVIRYFRLYLKRAFSTALEWSKNSQSTGPKTQYLVEAPSRNIPIF